MEYKIYKIVCNETDEVYYGKTTQKLEERLRQHKKELDCSSKQIIERGNYYIEHIDSIFDEEESIKLERYYIQNNKCINQIVPGRKCNEYYQDNKHNILKIRNIKYNCICGGTFTHTNKKAHEKTLIHQNFINSK